MQKIGITGSIGSGKTIVATIFKELGVPVYNADERAKYLMVSNQAIISRVSELFGAESYDVKGDLNRAHIANLAFNNKELLTQLNQTVHPVVFADFDNWVLEQRTQNHSYILKEAALMFETDSYKGLEKFIVVTAPLELRISRTVKRDNITKEQVEARMNNQWSQEEKLSKAHFEIKNDEAHSLIQQVVELHQRLIQA
ncbi:MAG: dephospho-CoA kinase [Bacteroidota bacterium]